MKGYLGAIWGLAFIFGLLSMALIRLLSMAMEGFHYHFQWYHWLLLVALSVFMAYAEGYRGFQRQFSPRVAARARYLIQDPARWHSLLAPFFCMGYFHTTRRRQISSIVLSLGIVMLVLLVRLVPQPWRGIIDTGVVIGLGWGVISLLYYSGQALLNDGFRYSPELPVDAVGHGK